jgi:protein GP2
MKRPVYADEVLLGGVSLRVNNGDGKYGCYREILSAIHDQLAAMLSHHSRAMVLRMDLHVERLTPDNLVLSRFLEKVKKRLSQHYKAKRMGYVWVREMEQAKKQHYHLALFIDGNKIQHPAKLIHWIDARWQARSHPKPFTPENCFYMIRRNDTRGFNTAFERLSYLAKIRGKSYRSKTVNDYSTSRIKHKEALK